MEDDMTRNAAIALLLVLIATPALAQKVHVDYDDTVDFSKYETFAWADSDETSVEDSDPMMHDRIVKAIEKKLIDGGMTEVESGSDLYVTYHTNEKEPMNLNATSFGYGYGPGWSWDPYWDFGTPGTGMSTSSVQTYKQGTLIIDIWDAATKEAVWRGSVEAIVQEDPEKGAKQIEKAIKKMAKKFEKIRAKGR
jgi:hypothetical protein